MRAGTLRGLRVEAALLAALLAAGLCAHGANLWVERHVHETREPGRVGPLPDGRVLRVLSLGFERLVADLFWLRTVYYVGDEESDRAGFPDAARLAELVTDIDPFFRSAYVIMNSVLTVLSSQPDAAIALLEKGIRHNDRYWKLHFLQGFTLFFDKGEFARAADHIRAAYERGGPAYLQLLAARLYARSGSPETALEFVEARLREERSPEARRRLERRRRDLWIARDLAAIDAAIARWRSERGGEPPRVANLVRAGLLAAEPRDPEGGRYAIRGGRAASDLEHAPLVLHGVEEDRGR